MQATGYIDGTIAALDETLIPITDRGFLYGDSVYEVLRTYSGVPFLFDEHYARLLNSAKLSNMQITQSKDEIIAAIKQTISAAGAKDEDIYVRYQITRGGGAVDLYPDLKSKTRLIVIVKPLPQWNPKFYARGVSLSVVKLQRNAINALNPNIKGGNYLNNILGLMEARATGGDECLMLDANGFVCECSNSNAWFVLDGELVTPAAGNLSGLTRKCLVELLGAAGHKNIEREVHVSELKNAREAFITSATREVMPVISLRLVDGDVVEFASGGGELTKTAMRLYRQMVKDAVAVQKYHAWF